MKDLQNKFEVYISHKKRRKKKGECNKLLEEEKTYDKVVYSSRIDAEHWTNEKLSFDLSSCKNKKSRFT